jgi:uncharacterized protein (DUF433 family)
VWRKDEKVATMSNDDQQLKQLIKDAITELGQEQPASLVRLLAAALSQADPIQPKDRLRTDTLRVVAETAAPGYAVTPPRELEEYLDFADPGEIRIQGHRVWLEHVVYEHVHNGLAPDELIARFPSLTPDEIYAVLLYYYRNQASVDLYVANWISWGEQMRAEQERNPTTDMLTLRYAWAERKARQQATAAAVA